MRIDSSGNVGIGASPDTGYKLHVQQDGANANAMIEAGTGYNLAALDFRGNGVTQGGISGGTSSTSGYLAFSTNNAGSIAERVRFAADGSVGIGTSVPSDMLELSGSSPEIRLTDSDLTSTYSVLSGNGGHVSIQADPAGNTSGSRITMEVDGTERMRVASGGQVSQPVTTITPSSSATVTYAVDMDASNIQNLVCHEDNADITINVSNMAAGKTVKLHVDFSSVSSFSSLTVNWNNNQVYEPDTAAAMVDGIGDDMINATYTNFMVDLTAYGTSASDVYGSATVFA